jgi:hypothetical protein
MKYLEAYKFPFRSPKWFQNALFCLLAVFVPIAGPMVIFGYQFEIIEALHLRRKEDDYPDFDINRLAKYLLRGAWPFLVALIVGLPVGFIAVIPFLVCYFGFFISLSPAGGAGSSPWTAVWGVLMALSFLFMMLLQILVQVVAIPMMLRAGLMQDFGAGFNGAFLKDFLRRAWAPILLAELFLVVSAGVLQAIGLLLCVGWLLVIPLAQLARAYLLWEVYEEYLRRGGTEVTLQVQPVEPVRRHDEDED